MIMQACLRNGTSFRSLPHPSATRTHYGWLYASAVMPASTSCQHSFGRLRAPALSQRHLSLFCRLLHLQDQCLRCRLWVSQGPQSHGQCADGTASVFSFVWRASVRASASRASLLSLCLRLCLSGAHALFLTLVAEVETRLACFTYEYVCIVSWSNFRG